MQEILFMVVSQNLDSLKRVTFHRQRLVNAHDSCWYRQYSEQTKKSNHKKTWDVSSKTSVLCFGV